MRVLILRDKHRVNGMTACSCGKRHLAANDGRRNVIPLRRVNDSNLDKKDYFYQPRLFRGAPRAMEKRAWRTGIVFMTGMVAGACLMLAALLLYPDAVMVLLRMVVQIIHAMGDKLW